MNILAISDVHDRFESFALDRLPAAAVCLIAGDLTNYGLRGEQLWTTQDRRSGRTVKAQASALAAGSFRELERAKVWLTALARRFPVYWIPGNHDIGIVNDTFGTIANCMGISDKTVTFGGMTIHGVSLTTCYNAPVLAAQWDYMTADPTIEAAAFDFEPVDIVLSHGPPFGCLDAGGYVLGEGRPHFGSPALYRYIERNAPRLVICGHIHEARGSERLEAGNGVTDVYNVAESFRLIHL